jgi:hypothetical protein
MSKAQVTIKTVTKAKPIQEPEPTVPIEKIAEDILQEVWYSVAEDIFQRVCIITELDEEQKDVVRQYVDLVLQENIGDGLLVETRVQIPSFSEFTGTADAIIYGDDWLKVVDLKGGRRVNVEAEYAGKVNPQLGFYALGALAQFPGWKPDDIEVIISQPRYGGTKRRKVTRQELAELESEMLEAVVLATSDNPPFAAGSHCNFCLARATCPTLRAYVYTLAKVDFDDFATAPV